MAMSRMAAVRRLLIQPSSSSSAAMFHDFSLQMARSLACGFSVERGAFGNQNFVQDLEIGCGVRHLRTHTKHKVILTTPIDRLGKAGEIVSVAPGYARNRLIPNLMALPAIDKFVLMVQNQIKQTGGAQVEESEVVEVKEETEEEKLKAVEAVLRRLAKGRVVLRRDVGMKTTLHKLVTKSDILAEVRRQLGVDLHEDNLVMETAFSEIGEYDVLLRLPEGLRLPGDKAKMFLKIRIRRK
ncbi:uncharacterized protein [Physcomitrium patens]|uniref:Large ribosomal subunit protein bL9c n=1 Tax=Physcomitrium patens TaxID=3218 RepID=A0A2K1K349_PHYPA|nr:uncharacterized protein LOC112286943 [Physcomitrium patens]PNR48201.1 hypothetical protein PHYPA_012676 [Physcomitrium patens]|eukprot:XP_024385189.1 uncharacterized protein LOC112286943 [Physcomitrella patens]